MNSRRPITCATCGRQRRHKGRGLCGACWYRHWKDGTLADFERATRPRDELLDEWARLQREGYTRRQAAERIGITKKRLEKAIERANRENAGAAA